MGKNNTRVSPSGDQWKTHRENAKRVSGIFDTQREAEAYGRNILKNSGGGELIAQNQQGQIRSKDTNYRADPYPPKDKEH